MSALNWTADAFRSRELESARLEAELLLAHATGLTRVELYTLHDRPLSLEERELFRDLVRRRMEGEPSQYLTGTQEFWSLSLKVTPDVLIPRGDTEVLVEEALEHLRSRGLDAPLIIDVGTGSGAIAIALAREFPDARVIGCDVSVEALAVARENVQRHAVDVKLMVGRLPDVLAKLQGTPDVVVSNPPYIPSERMESLMVEVRAHEPRLALDGGDDGLVVFREIIPAASECLGPGAGLFLEIGDTQQASAVCGLLEDAAGWEDPRVRSDYAGQARVVCAHRAV